MKKLLILLTMGIFGMVALAAQATTPEKGESADILARGAYVARASNCLACHTYKDGNFAGGVPFGFVNSPNITPDQETGIGNFSFEDFDSAIRQGVSPKGYSLSVMMPPSYSIMTDEDIRDLYEFFMKGVPAVNYEVKDMGTKREDTPPRKVMPFAPDSGEDAAVARGRYLVSGLGHCGFCHTPRNDKHEEKALWPSEGKEFLSGSPYAGWIAINLRGDHMDGLAGRSAEDLTEFLLTGRNDYTAAFGKMTEIVELSTQYLRKEDAAAMAAFLKSLPAKDSSKKLFKEDRSVAEKLWKGDDSMRGASVYVDSCASCHKTDGSGYKRFFPELRGNPVVMSESPIGLIHIVLMGQTLPGLTTAPSSITMPPFGWRLDDEQTADVVTFIRNSWGNKAPAVTAEEVKTMREDKSLFPDPRIFGDKNVDNLLDKQY